MSDTVELIQQLIRNACVNDGSVESGQEVRSTDVLKNYLEGSGLDLETFEAAPGRTSLVTRIEGSDRDAPALMLMGHTDVVPVNPDSWSHDPHGGELIDGEVWGRGAVDMLNLTASMAVATKRLAESGFRPKGTLVYLAVADEEALGEYGAKFMTERHPDAVTTDYLITEMGGIPMPTAGGPPVLNVVVGEKGPYWCRLTVKGTPGHGSMPFGADSAIVKAAEVVRRIAAFQPPGRVDELWQRAITALGMPDEVVSALTDPARMDDMLAALPPSMGRFLHACTHTTMSPNVVRGGSKMNVIPDRVELDVDIRALPDDDIPALLDAALGDLRDTVDVDFVTDEPANLSPADTPLWQAMERASSVHYPGVKLIPTMMPATTDARFFRRLGVTCYGYGLFSERIGFEQFGSMFHGNDERVDVESLRLTTELWQQLANDLLG